MKSKKPSKRIAKKVTNKAVETPEQIRTRLGKELILIALTKTHGIVTEACRLADVSRSTFYFWIHEDKRFAAAVSDVDEQAIDFTESQLFKLIAGIEVVQDKLVTDSKGKKTVKKLVKQYPPDVQAVIFHLSTQAKHRGYQKTTEVVLPEQITKINITRRVLNSKDDLQQKADGI